MLTVLGGSGAFPGPGRPCSGFLVDDGDTRLVVDLGWGTAVALFEQLADPHADDLDAVVITHAHPDHMSDLAALFRVRWFERRNAQPIPLLAPRSVLDRLAVDHDGEVDDLHRVFDWHDPEVGGAAIGDLRLEPVFLPHWVPNVGVRISGSAVLAISGDTGSSSELNRLGERADLFVLDATDRHQQPGREPVPPGSPVYNLTARQAGAAARAAGARALMITHLWPGNDEERARREAAEGFGDDVLLARPGTVVDLG